MTKKNVLIVITFVLFRLMLRELKTVLTFVLKKKKMQDPPIIGVHQKKCAGPEEDANGLDEQGHDADEGLGVQHRHTMSTDEWPTTGR